MTGFRSNSIISGSFSISFPTDKMISSSSLMLTPFFPLAPLRIGYVLSDCIISLAWLFVSGHIPMLMSLSISAYIPPSPTITVGPNCMSLFPPISISVPLSICCIITHSKPSIFFIFLNVSVASLREFMPIFTPPTSVLWVMFFETTFIATGKPMFLHAFFTWFSFFASCILAVLIPYFLIISNDFVRLNISIMNGYPKYLFKYVAILFC